MDEPNKITWVDNNEDLLFSSTGTCDEGFFNIACCPVDEVGYVLSFTPAPMGIANGKRVGQEIQLGDLPSKYVAGGEGENETWARNSAKMRANKQIEDEFPEVEQPDWWVDDVKPTPHITPSATSTGETAPAGAKAPTQRDSTPAGEGHNAVNAKQVSEFVNRIERLTYEKSEINEAIKDVYAEAEAYGHPAKVLRKLVQLRKEDPDRLAEFEGQLSFYRDLVGI